MRLLMQFRKIQFYTPLHFTMALLLVGISILHAAAQTRYELVSDAKDIEVGATYLFVGYTGGNYYALGAQGADYRNGVKVTLHTESASEGVETTYINIDTESVTPVTLVANGKYYNLQTTDGIYLSGESGSRLQETTTSNINTALWEVLGITSAGSTRLRNRSGNYLRFYGNGTNFRSPSSESGNAVRLFKANVPTALGVPTFSPSGGRVTVGQTVTIAATGSGAKLQIQTRHSDDDTPLTGNFSEWENYENRLLYPLTEPGIIDIRARSVSADGKQFSDVAEARFTIVSPTSEDSIFERIYSTEQLVEGGIYLIVFNGSEDERSATVALGSQSGNNRNGVPVEIGADGTIDITTCTVRPTLLTVKGITISGKITFLTDDATPAYLYTPSTDVNELRTYTSGEDGDNTKYIVTFAGETATIANAAGKRFIGVNLSVDKGMFRTYTASNEAMGISTSLQVFALRSMLTSLPSIYSTPNGLSSNEIYDLQGRRVTQPTKGGVYIIGGRKVVVK